MTVFDFTLKLNRMPDDDQIEALYAAGCDDGTFSEGTYGPIADFHRQANTWAEALGTAVADIETVDGLLVVGAGQDDQVTLLDIARRTRRTREAVRLWAAGKRGPGGFPAPTWTSPSGERFWAWSDVAAWLHDVRGISVDVVAQEIEWADDILRARVAEMEAQRVDPEFSREFGRLMNVA